MLPSPYCITRPQWVKLFICFMCCIRYYPPVTHRSHTFISADRFHSLNCYLLVINTQQTCHIVSTRTRRKPSGKCLRSLSTFTPWCSPDNAWRPQIWPVLLSQRGTIMRKINGARPKSYQFWRWSGYISMQNSWPFSPCVLREMSGNPKFDLFH